MVGEEFAWNMLKKGLDLSEEDVEELRAGILALKDMAPDAIKRAEMLEKRVLAICLYLKEHDEAGWKKAEEKALRLTVGKG